MRLLSMSVVAFVLCTTLNGCGGGLPPRDQATAAKESAAPTTGSGGEHGAADAVPGSYEDWCDEHDVAETACTRCDPSLVPAFKATGDWDDEHGLPRSQCLKCDPNLKIVRPPQSEAN